MPQKSTKDDELFFEDWLQAIARVARSLVKGTKDEGRPLVRAARPIGSSLVFWRVVACSTRGPIERGCGVARSADGVFPRHTAHGALGPASPSQVLDLYDFWAQRLAPLLGDNK